MKRVCHISSVHSNSDVRIFSKECRSLANAGYEVFYVVPAEIEEIIEGVKIIPVQKLKISRFRRMTQTVWTVYKKAKSLNADVYHLHDPELLSIALLLKSRRSKVIFDAHEDVSKQILGKYWINKHLRFTISKVFRIFENLITKRIDGVIAATPSIALRFEGVNSNVININNYPLLNELESFTSWKDKKNEVCYVGGITEIRGCAEIINCFKDIENVRLNIAGNISPDSFREKLISYSGWEKVNELGLINRKEVANVLSRSKAGLVTFYPLPNHIDAQPNKMFEYMSAGIPVIGSNFPLWEEIILNNNCGLCVNPESPEEIKNAILFLILNNERAEEMGKNGRKAVMEKYNWEKEKLKLFSFYQKLLVN